MKRSYKRKEWEAEQGGSSVKTEVWTGVGSKALQESQTVMRLRGNMHGFSLSLDDSGLGSTFISNFSSLQL